MEKQNKEKKFSINVIEDARQDSLAVNSSIPALLTDEEQKQISGGGQPCQEYCNKLQECKGTNGGYTNLCKDGYVTQCVSKVCESSYSWITPKPVTNN